MISLELRLQLRNTWDNEVYSDISNNKEKCTICSGITTETHLWNLPVAKRYKEGSPNIHSDSPICGKESHTCILHLKKGSCLSRHKMHNFSRKLHWISSFPSPEATVGPYTWHLYICAYGLNFYHCYNINLKTPFAWNPAVSRFCFNQWQGKGGLLWSDKFFKDIVFQWYNLAGEVKCVWKEKAEN